MSPVNFGIISDIYLCSSKSTTKIKLVKNPELRYFSISLDKLIIKLGDSVQDEYWRSLIRELKSLRFELCAAPLSQSYLIAKVENGLKKINETSSSCKLTYPNVADFLPNLFILLQKVLQEYKNEIKDGILEISNELNKKDIAILLKESRLIPQAEETIVKYQGSNRIYVVSAELLRDANCYDKLIVIGPPRWFPEYIFNSPRAKEIIILHHTWIKGLWKPEPIFLEEVKQHQKPIIVSTASQEENLGDSIEAEELLPPILDLVWINKSAEDEAHNQVEYVEARAYILEGEWVVFLEADDESSVSVIDLETNNARPIKRIKMRDLETGMFLLLRTSGGGDFIIPVANKILGENSAIAREFQKEWKRLLRTIVRTKGFDYTISKLKEYGSIKANKTNIGNWISERTIRTEEIEDFAAIMKFVGLEKHTQEYWKMMKLIDAAHLQAGVIIRKMLLAQVQKISIQDLRRTGIVEFTIPGENVSITAFRINHISDTVVRVMPWRLGNPIKQDY